MLDLLARFAENSYWLARYMERAENLARTLDVNETFAQNSEGVNEWLPIVQLYADSDRFFERHSEATADAVLHFYILDRENPNSVLSTVYVARENARSLRHLISTETWQQLNVFYNRLLKLQPRDLALSQLSRLCLSIKEDCQLHTGIIEGTGFRDQAWYIYQIGKYLERMDQTTRLLDINYHRLLPSLQQVGTEIELQPLECGAALGRRLPCVPPGPSARHEPEHGRVVPAVRPVVSALGRGVHRNC